MSPADLPAWMDDPARRPLVMGVLNVTPDSFSDGGRFVSPAAAVEHARRMIADGADWVDVGGESTRPGSDPVADEEQVRRVVPVIEALRPLGAVVSIDTTRAAVAEAALSAGASVINDVSAGRDDRAILPLAALQRCPIILMHRAGIPRTMQQSPTYADVVGEIERFLLDRADAAAAAGVHRGRIMLDVGIGFGKTSAHNLSLLKALDRFTSLPYPHLVGTSRKRFIGEITAEPSPEGRAFGTAATVAWAVSQGAAVVRVHDVGPMRQVVAVADAIRRAT